MVLDVGRAVSGRRKGGGKEGNRGGGRSHAEPPPPWRDRDDGARTLPRPIQASIWGPAAHPCSGSCFSAEKQAGTANQRPAPSLAPALLGSLLPAPTYPPSRPCTSPRGRKKTRARRQSQALRHTCPCRPKFILPAARLPARFAGPAAPPGSSLHPMVSQGELAAGNWEGGGALLHGGGSPLVAAPEGHVQGHSTHGSPSPLLPVTRTVRRRGHPSPGRRGAAGAPRALHGPRRHRQRRRRVSDPPARQRRRQRHALRERHVQDRPQAGVRPGALPACCAALRCAVWLAAWPAGWLAPSAHARQVRTSGLQATPAARPRSPPPTCPCFALQQVLKVVGSGPELGNWDCSRAPGELASRPACSAAGRRCLPCMPSGIATTDAALQSVRCSERAPDPSAPPAAMAWSKGDRWQLTVNLGPGDHEFKVGPEAAWTPGQGAGCAGCLAGWRQRANVHARVGKCTFRQPLSRPAPPCLPSSSPLLPLSSLKVAIASGDGNCLIGYEDGPNRTVKVGGAFFLGSSLRVSSSDWRLLIVAFWRQLVVGQI